VVLRFQLLLQLGQLRLKIGDLLLESVIGGGESPCFGDVVLQFFQFVGKLLVLLEGRLEELILLLDFLFQFAGHPGVVLGRIVHGHSGAERHGGFHGRIEVPTWRLLRAVNDMRLVHHGRIVRVFIAADRVVERATK
jgi:hypothetical protein